MKNIKILLSEEVHINKSTMKDLDYLSYLNYYICHLSSFDKKLFPTTYITGFSTKHLDYLRHLNQCDILKIIEYVIIMLIRYH